MIDGLLSHFNAYNSTKFGRLLYIKRKKDGASSTPILLHGSGITLNEMNTKLQPHPYTMNLTDTVKAVSVFTFIGTQEGHVSFYPSFI